MCSSKIKMVNYMIDEKKIEDASIAYSKLMREEAEKDEFGKLCDPVDILADSILSEIVFKEGAHWAIQEFLKDLWHDVSEEPKPNNKKDHIIVQFDDSSFGICNLDWYNDCPLKDWSTNGVINRWCYLSDLLPKQKGGEQ